MNWMEPFLHWLAIHTGTVNESGSYYGFWSGFGSDLGEVAILGGLVTMYRKHSCHTKGCWRIGKHTVDGTPWCSRHHVAARAAVRHADIAGQVCLHVSKSVDEATAGLHRRLDDHADLIRAAAAAQAPAPPRPRAPKGTRL